MQSLVMVTVREFIPLECFNICSLIDFADERSIEQEAEKKVGWLLKLIFAGTATVIGYQIFPYMGKVSFLWLNESFKPYLISCLV